ncbi:hypothetical protein [Xanthomonas citri]|uniref:hypothetical protein n=1 Tax=Xanthomonas citri TaxID=346 RepID=UPI00051CCDE3|nr:hypothetical protein [Xanthomonas citri]KGK67070.1 hypothetical protein NB99_04940 [Xanthomonas citri pv. fuscans]
MKRLLILAVLALTLAGCDTDFRPREPRADYGSCLSGHNETSTMLTGGGVGAYMGGVPLGSGMHIVTTTSYVCDRHEYPNGDSPSYFAAYDQYLVDLAAWHKRPPEKTP